MGNLLMRFVANRAPNLYFPKIKKRPKAKASGRCVTRKLNPLIADYGYCMHILYLMSSEKARGAANNLLAD